MRSLQATQGRRRLGELLEYTPASENVSHASWGLIRSRIHPQKLVGVAKSLQVGMISEGAKHTKM